MIQFSNETTRCCSATLEPERIIMKLDGTYRGLSPTDESGVGMGELELVIDDSFATSRFATGLTIETDQGPRSEIQEMSQDEIADLFEPGATLTGTSGYKFGEDGPIILIFAESQEEPNSPRALVLRFISEEIDSIFGPTPLFIPSQVDAGLFDQALAEIESKQGDPGVIPRLANNGMRG